VGAAKRITGKRRITFLPFFAVHTANLFSPAHTPSQKVLLLANGHAAADGNRGVHTTPLCCSQP